MSLNPIFKFKKENGQGIFHDKEKLGEYLAGLPDGDYEILVRRKVKGRSKNQNDYMWGVVLQLLSDHTGHSPDEMHEAMKKMFNPIRIEIQTKKGLEFISTGKTTTGLSTIKMEEYLSQVRQWASEYLGVFIPLPNEVDID